MMDREGLPENILDIVRFCAVECHLQMSGEQSVGWMLNGWSHAMKCPQAVPTGSTVRRIGACVEPQVNKDGYRTVNVRVGSSVKPPWGEVPAMMTDFLAQPMTTPEEWFRQYEEIHPFRDGNGRSGVILYNLLRGSLLDPEWPPNFWNDLRRTPGFGAPDASPTPAYELSLALKKGRIVAPWTDAHVEALSLWQNQGQFHPYTCAHRDGHPMDPEGDRGVLVPTKAGWVCRHCDYTQLWAHDPLAFMD